MSMKSQIILIVGVIMLLAQVSMNVNGSVLNSKDFSYENEALIAASSFAQSMIRQISNRKFDEKVIAKGVTSTDSLTAPEYLGSDFGETEATFDDVDDYHGLSRTLTNGRLGNFAMNVSVSYTSPASPGTVSATRTFLKRVQVTVSGNRYLKNNVVMSSIVSY